MSYYMLKSNLKEPWLYPNVKKQANLMCMFVWIEI